MPTLSFKRIFLSSVFIVLFGSGLYAQKPISPSTLRIALSGMGWSRLPADSEINAAFSEYKSRLPKHCSIIKSSFKVHGGWYPDDPLMDNKALLVSQCTDSYTKKVSVSVASLKYDYQTGKFKFENVLIPGQRDPDDPKHKERLVETAYYLHPVDLAPLQSGWTSGGGRNQPQPNPRPYPSPNPPQPIDNEDDDSGWLTTVIGIIGAGLVIGIIARLRKNKKKGDAQKKKNGKKKEEEKEEEHYITDLSQV